MALHCPNCGTELSFWTNKIDKPFPCRSCGTKIKIKSNFPHFLFYILPPLVDVLFLAMFYAIRRKTATVCFVNEEDKRNKA